MVKTRSSSSKTKRKTKTSDTNSTSSGADDGVNSSFPESSRDSDESFNVSKKAVKKNVLSSSGGSESEYSFTTERSIPSPSRSSLNSSRNSSKLVEENNDIFSKGQGLLIIILIALVAYIMIDLSNNEKNNGKNVSFRKAFINQIKKCQNDSEQDARLWKLINASYLKHIEDLNPNQPAVFMLASTKKAEKTRENLAEIIAKKYSIKCGNRQFHKVDGRFPEYGVENSDEAKKNLDEDVQRFFAPGEACALIVSHIEALPPMSTSLFYSYCENDSAPHKNATVIFTLEVEYDTAWDADKEYVEIEKTGLLPGKLWEPAVLSYLSHSLKVKDKTKSLNDNFLGGLLSRITPAVAWIKEEENIKC